MKALFYDWMNLEKSKTQFLHWISAQFVHFFGMIKVLQRYLAFVLFMTPLGIVINIDFDVEQATVNRCELWHVFDALL